MTDSKGIEGRYHSLAGRLPATRVVSRRARPLFPFFPLLIIDGSGLSTGVRLVVHASPPGREGQREFLRKCRRRIIHSDGRVVLWEGMAELRLAVLQLRVTSLELRRPVIRSSRRRPRRSCRRAPRAFRERGEARGNKHRRGLVKAGVGGYWTR